MLCYMFVSKTYASLNKTWYNYNACRGKDICIIQGPDMNYSRNFHAQSSLIDNRYILLISGYGKVKKDCVFTCPEDNLTVCDKPELYDSIRNKFIKLPKISFPFKEYTQIIKGHDNNFVVLGYSDREKGHTFFNSKTLTFDSSNKSFDTDINTLKTFAWDKKINDNKYLVQFTNGTSKLYILNPYKVVDLKNDPLEDNLFKLELENGDIIYVNKDSSYIFKNFESKFLPTDKETSQKLAEASKNLENYANFYYGQSVDTLINVPLKSGKYLFMCNRRGFFSDDKVDDYCKKTILYDYKNNTVTEGPHFLFPPTNAGISKLNDNKWLITGGGLYKNDHNHSQILIVKDRR